jgi:mono/diheme cytochrome c family protein
MKRTLKIIGTLALVLVLILLIGASFIHFRGIPSYETGKVNLTVPITPERVQQGQKLASVMCVECHYGSDDKLSGKLLTDLPKEFGKIYSRNITQDKEVGIGSWTDGELYYLLRTGVGRDGKYIPPYMVKYANASEEDIFSIIAWLRSDKSVVQASKVEPQESEPSFLTKFLCLVAFKPLPLNPDAIPQPDTSNALTYGKYLTSVYQCYECHSADFKTNNQFEPEKSIGYFGGGNKLFNLQGEQIIAPNITFDPSGIGHYVLQDFVTTMRTGKKPDGAQMKYPMMPHSLLTDAELNAMYEYLRSVPKINSKKEL